MNLDRRVFLSGLSAAIAAPYVVKSGILIPVKAIITPTKCCLLEVSNNGTDWCSLAYLNVKTGKMPDYKANYPTLLGYATANFKQVRAVFDVTWTPKTLQGLI